MGKGYLDEGLKAYYEEDLYDWNLEDSYSNAVERYWKDKDTIWHYDHTKIASTYTDKERQDIRQKWVGALVRFGGHIYTNMIYDYSSGSTPIDNTIPDLKMTGTAISVTPNYKDAWIVEVYWSNGTITSESANDLMIVQGPGTHSRKI